MEFADFSTQLSCGILFGIFMEKGNVHLPQVIRAQMHFDSLVMMKMFLSAMAASSFSFALLSLKSQNMRSIIEGHRKRMIRTSIVKFVSGGAFLGMGMAICGSCPGTVYVQLGTLSWRTLFVFLGCLLGGYGYSHVDKFYPENDSGKFLGLTSNRLFVSDILQQPFHIVCFGASGALLILAILLEIFSPSTASIFSEFSSNSWNPVICGCLVGLLQIPMVWFSSTRLGASASFLSIVGYISPQMRNDYVNRFMDKSSLRQMLFSTAITFGSFLSLYQLTGESTWEFNDSTLSYGTPGIISCIIGGFLIVFGARAAGGCTSGHGLSGAGLLSFPSLLVVASIFGGGILTSLLFI
ncbi:hypothetical protein SNEBB_003076 [Seison nebaliae]|nr:hypothetical protein SNEBB_003076 [Seison nebaliae]